MGTIRAILSLIFLWLLAHGLMAQSSTAQLDHLYTHGIIVRTTATADTLTEAPNSYLQVVSRPSLARLTDQTPACATEDPTYITVPKAVSAAKSLTTPILNVYFEIDHHTYLELGQDINTCLIWLSQNFDHVTAIYAQQQIDIRISEVFIWDTPDIYSGLNVSGRLLAFGDRCGNNFNGDAAQLITTAPIGGGKAHIDKLCHSYNPIDHSGPYSVIASMDASTANTSPIFWNVYGIAHELGHVIGAPHTHACLWGPNNDEPLDNCWFSEGGCPPIEGESIGTIMSYCHLNAGTDLYTGFGSEVGGLLLAKLQTNPCIMGDCPKDKMVMEVTPATSTDRAFRTLTSSAMIESNMTHSFSANESIAMTAGFEVENGAVFEAALTGCLDE